MAMAMAMAMADAEVFSAVFWFLGFRVNVGEDDDVRPP
jgi:hypothetical protein